MVKPSFIKFPSIDNTYRLSISDIEKIDSNISSKWCISEKIDGMNIQISINPSDYQIYSRNQELPLNTVNDIKAKCPYVFELIEKTQKKFISLFGSNITQINLYGELYGKGIQNRIHYSESKYVKFFAYCQIDNEETLTWKSREDLEKWIIPLQGKECLVSIYGLPESLKDSLKYVEQLIKNFNTTSILHTEGVVISPYNYSMFTQGKSFTFKWKTDKFAESKGTKNKTVVQSDTVIHLKDTFKDYCVISRMYGIFSKLGNPESNKDIKRYLVAFIKDAKEDFIKDFPEINDLQEKDKNFIFNVGKLPYTYYCEVFKTIKD